MRIAVVHLGFFYAGGGERLVLEEVRGLRRLGHEVECFAPVVIPGVSYPELLAEVGVRTLLPQPPSWLPGRAAIWVLAACLLAPLLVFRLRRFDVILAANQPAPWIAWTAHRLLGIPYVAYLAQPTRVLYPRPVDLEISRPTLDYQLFLGTARLVSPLVRWADRTSIAAAAGVLANGVYMAEVLERIYRRPMIVCPAGSHPVPREDIARVRPHRGRIEVNRTCVMKPYVLLTNRHYPQKRFEHAILAMASVPEASLIITGAFTTYTDQMRELARKVGLADRVLFLGLVSETDLERLYAGASAYVYPAPQEDYGMGIVEAMGHGVPVVAWRAAGPTSTVVDGKTGFLVEPFDQEAFGHRLASLIDDRRLAHRMGRAGWRRVNDELGYRTHCQRIETELIQALNGARRPSLAPALRMIIQGAFGLGMLWLWLRTIPLADLWLHARPRSLPTMLALVVLLIGAGLLRTWRLTTLLRPTARIRLLDVLWINAGGALINYLVPIRAGEVTKIWWLARRHRVLPGSAVAAIVVDRTFDLGMVAALLATGALAHAASNGRGATVGLWASAAAACGLLAAVLVTAGLGPRIARSPGLARLLPAKVVGTLTTQAFSFRAGLASVATPAQLLRLGAASLGALLLDATAFGLLFVALGIQIPLGSAMVAYGALVLSFALPAAPGYVGSLEVAGSIVIGAGLGLSAPAAAGAILLWHAIGAGLVLTMGMVGLSRLSRKVAPPAEQTDSHQQEIALDGKIEATGNP